MCSLWHFQAIGREFPVHSVGQESQSRAFFLDRTTAAVWRGALADLAKRRGGHGDEVIKVFEVFDARS
jgi:hypothetical protein